MAYDVKEMEQYIRKAAQARGIDPDIAVRVAKSEGLARNTWQSNVNHPTRGREPSYGPFQLLEGGKGGWPAGMGNDFRRQTGLDPSDPRNAFATVDFALDRAAKGGWSPWYGARNSGIGNMQGIGGNASPMGMTLTSAPAGVQRLASAGREAAPALPPPREIQDRPIASSMSDAPIADGPFPDAPKGPSPFDAFQQDGFKAGMAALNNSSQFQGGLGLLAGSQKPQQEDRVIQTGALQAAEAADAGRMQAGQQLMNALLMNKKKGIGPKGLSLMG